MVRGPCVVKVDGTCRLLGMDVSNKPVQVRPGKVLPFEPESGCMLVLDRGLSWHAEPAEAGTFMWSRLAKRIIASARTRLSVMIVGATDTGKSTLSTYLANVAAKRGIFPCIIDGDMGQGDLAPPAAIGAALVSKQVTDLRDIPTGYYEFVGSITPAGSEGLVVRKMRSLASRTKDVSCLHIINTDGYVHDGGAIYKKMLARAIAPDIVVCLGRNRALASALGDGPWAFMSARSGAQTAKTWSERAGRRMDQFMRHIEDGIVCVQPENTGFVHRERSISFSRVIHLFPPAAIEGMFVGLGLRGIVRGFGIIERLDTQICVRTSVREFDTIHLSKIAIRDGVEDRIR